MKTVAIIQARTGSTRLPHKILRDLRGKPMLEQQIDRLKNARTLDLIVVATTDKPEDDEVEQLVKSCGAEVFRGSEIDVLDRFCKAARKVQAGIVVRLTGDCPLIDPEVVDAVVEHFRNLQLDYTHTPRNYPEGLDTEVFSFQALEHAWKEARLPSEREHVTPYIRMHKELFKSDEWHSGEGEYSSLHWSVDTEADFRFVEAIYIELYIPGKIFHMNDVLELLKRRPELREIHKGGTGYEGYEKSLKEDEASLHSDFK